MRDGALGDVYKEIGRVDVLSIVERRRLRAFSWRVLLLPCSCGGKLRFGLREVAVDRNRMLLIGSAIALVVVIAYMMLGPGGPSAPR